MQRARKKGKTRVGLIRSRREEKRSDATRRQAKPSQEKRITSKTFCKNKKSPIHVSQHELSALAAQSPKVYFAACGRSADEGRPIGASLSETSAIRRTSNSSCLGDLHLPFQCLQSPFHGTNRWGSIGWFHRFHQRDIIRSRRTPRPPRTPSRPPWPRLRRYGQRPGPGPPVPRAVNGHPESPLFGAMSLDTTNRGPRYSL